MDRQYYLDLAASGLRLPIGTDLALREHADHADIVLDGRRLGGVVADAANRYGSPLGVPLMDLTVEKETLLTGLGVDAAAIATHHLDAAPDPGAVEAALAAMAINPTPRQRANLAAIQHVARETDLLPCGMAIGPFSLMTKLLADPIGPVYMAGAGATGEDDPEVALLEAAIDTGLRAVLQSIEAQIAAGAQLVVLCEPAANLVYLSPKQLARGSDIFERLVMEPNRKVVALLQQAGVDLFFHDCGELTPEMVQAFGTLRPVVMSLGSSRRLWEDAALVPDDIVLYGNLPTKQFFSSSLTVEDVERMACDLLGRMRGTGQPFILGSECDVLSVPDSHDQIVSKVNAFVRCACV